MYKLHPNILVNIITVNGFITQFKVQTYRLVIKTKPISFRRDGTLDK